MSIRLTLTIATFGILLSFILFYASSTTFAASDLTEVCKQNKQSSLCEGYKEGSGSSDDANPVIKVMITIINILSFATGALAVIFITWGGFKYVIGEGESNQVSEAKKIIVYALVGLLVAVVGRTIVVFVLNRLL